MGGRWSLVQIQSPRPFLSAPTAGAGLREGLGPGSAGWVAPSIVRRISPGVADRACLALARLLFHAGLPVRRAQEQNLARLLDQPIGTTIRARARESFEHFALALCDFLRLEGVGPQTLARSVEVRGGEHFEAARASGRGVILLSAHLGNWEWGAAWLPVRVRGRARPAHRRGGAARGHDPPARPPLRRVLRAPGALRPRGRRPVPPLRRGARRELPHHAAALPRPLPRAVVRLRAGLRRARLMRVAALIPAYQAAASLGEVLLRLAALEPAPDVLVVDDGSRDATAEVARQFGARLLSFAANRGKG